MAAAHAVCGSGYRSALDGLQASAHHNWSSTPRASAACAGRLDAVAQRPVGGNHDDATPVTDGNLPHHLLDDRVVPRPFWVNRVDAAS